MLREVSLERNIRGESEVILERGEEGAPLRLGQNGPGRGSRNATS